MTLISEGFGGLRLLSAITDTHCRMISLMLAAISGSNVSIHISPGPMDVKRPTSMKKTLSVAPHLWKQIKLSIKKHSMDRLPATHRRMLDKANST